MEAAFLEAATAAWAIVSALAVAALGIAALAGGRSRPPGGLAFGAFALLWGLQAAAGQWMAYAGADTVERAHLAYLALLLPLPYLLVEFSAAYAPRAGAGFAWRALRTSTAAIALLGALLLVARPDALYRGVRADAQGLTPVWGPLFAAFAIVPFFLALGFALHALDAARRAAPTARTATRTALLVAGLGTFTAFSAGNNLLYYLSDLLTLGASGLAPVYLLLFAALSASILVLGIRAWIGARDEPSLQVRRAGHVVAAATLAPFAWGLVEGALAYDLLPYFSTVGLWRLVGVALLGYALARWHVPDLRERTRRGAATAVGIAGAAVAGGLSVGVFLILLPGTSAPLVAGAAVPLAALAPSVRLARRAFGADEDSTPPDAELAQRIDTYRAALEASIARASLATDASFLTGLRKRLAITDDVHEALVCIARANVLAPADEPYGGVERLRLLGEGAQGRAWLARRRSDDELVVLKEPLHGDRAGAAALAKQARLMKGVRHPNLVAVQDVLEGPNGPLLVMEHAPGGTLADRLERGPLPAAEAVERAREVLAGLDALHGHGLVHGDIKAANVLLGTTGRAKLADFGLARAYAPDATRTHVGVQGTLAALAPEQVDGAPATPASDVYAAGALLYHLLTGEHYVELRDASAPEAHARIRALAPALPHPLVPDAVAPVIARALAKRPEDRWPSAAAMRAALAPGA